MAALHDLSIQECGSRMRAGDLTSEGLTRYMLERMERLDPTIHSFVTPTPDTALKEARERDAELAKGIDRGALHGIPFGVKDLIDAAGVPTTYCSAHYKDNPPAKMDAAVVGQLRNAGAVLLGKQTTHEFGFGGPSFDLPFPPARNPWNPDHYAGGSSSGSAAAVAAGVARFAIGSDAGGSVCSPAALCGVVGLKPTHNLISPHGGWGSSAMLGHNGILARTVEDTAIVLGIAVAPAKDGASGRVDYTAGLNDGVRGLRIGIPRNFLNESAAPHPEVIAGVDKIADLLREEGAHVEDFTLPEFELFASCGRVIIHGDAHARHERQLINAPEKYGVLTRRQVLLGPAVSAADYTKAVRMKDMLSEIVDEAYKPFDAVLALGVHGVAPGINDVGKMPWLVQQQHVNNNLTGMPAITMPTALVNGLPASVMLSARRQQEQMLLRVARSVEKLSGWSGVVPAHLDA